METFIDTHAHYDDESYNADREELFAYIKANGVAKVINASSSFEASAYGIRLAEKYPFIYAAVGVHPHYTDNLTNQMFTELEQMTACKKVIAIGETGLDFYYEHSKKETQRFWFLKHLELAKKADLPVIIHSRDAAGEVFETMAKQGLGLRGVIHCYSGSPEMAEKYVKMGFYIGIGGVITFKNAKKLPDVVEAVNIENILLETDCPYLSPAPNRGKRNDSSNIKYIAQKVSEIKGISYGEVCRITSESACRLFKI